MAGGRSSDIPSLIVAGITFCFNEEAKKERTKQYEQIVTKAEEQKAVGHYESAGDIGNAALHTEGDEYTFEGIDEGYGTDITTLTYGKGAYATRKQMKDDQTNTVKNIAAKLVQAAHNTKEQVCADAYNDGFATNSGSDGVYTFSNTHPLTNATGQYNDNLVTGALTVDNFKSGITQFSLIKDMAGNIFHSKATHLLANTMQQFTIYELLNSQLLAYQLSNTINSLKAVAPIGVILNDYIDHTSKGDTYSPWFLLDKTIDKAGCVLQYRGGMQLEMEINFKTKNWEYTVEEEYAVAFVSPGYGAIGSQG
jgi:phage major head subunit gpT-like protein